MTVPFGATPAAGVAARSRLSGRAVDRTPGLSGRPLRVGHLPPRRVGPQRGLAPRRVDHDHGIDRVEAGSSDPRSGSPIPWVKVPLGARSLTSTCVRPPAVRAQMTAALPLSPTAAPTPEIAVVLTACEIVLSSPNDPDAPLRTALRTTGSGLQARVGPRQHRAALHAHRDDQAVVPGAVDRLRCAGPAVARHREHPHGSAVEPAHGRVARAVDPDVDLPGAARAGHGGGRPEALARQAPGHLQVEVHPVRRGLRPGGHGGTVRRDGDGADRGRVGDVRPERRVGWSHVGAAEAGAARMRTRASVARRSGIVGRRYGALHPRSRRGGLRRRRTRHYARTSFLYVIRCGRSASAPSRSWRCSS